MAARGLAVITGSNTEVFRFLDDSTAIMKVKNKAGGAMVSGSILISTSSTGHVVSQRLLSPGMGKMIGVSSSNATFNTALQGAAGDNANLNYALTWVYEQASSNANLKVGADSDSAGTSPQVINLSTEILGISGSTAGISTTTDTNKINIALNGQLVDIAGMTEAETTALAALSATEIAILDDATVTTAELNILDGGTSATSTTVADADRVVLNDNGTMVQVAVTDLAAYFDDEITAMPNLVTTAATTVGALNAGSITSGFGNIDNGASTITTTGLISGGSLDIDDVLINGATIGHTDDTDLLTLANGVLTVAGEVSMTTLDLGGTNVTADANEINVLDGATSANNTANKAVLMDGSGNVTLAGDLTVTGNTITNQVEVVSTSTGVLFEGGANDGHEATLISSVADSDKTYTLPNLSGHIPLLADAATAASAAVTAAEMAILDGGTSATATTVADADRVVLNDNGTMVQAAVTDLDTYFSATSKTLTNKTISGANNTLSNIGNGSLTNSAVTIGSTSLSLGGTSTSFSGLTGLDFTAANASVAASIGANVLTLGSSASTVSVPGVLRVTGSISASSNITASNIILDHNHLVNVGTPAGTARVLLHNTTTGELEYATASSLGANFNFSVGHSGGSAVAVSDEEIIGFTGSTGLSVAVADQSTNTSVTYTLNNQLQDIAGMTEAETTALAALSSTEIAILDDATVTTAELNILDGGTSATGTTLADADRVVVNDNGTMVQVALTDFETYFETALDTLSNVTTVGALDAGSITSNFGNINNGASTITTTGLISGGSLDIDDVLINGANIGHTDDTDLLTLANGIVTVAGEVSMTTLDIGGTNVAATAAELNIMDGNTSATATTLATADRVVVNDDGTMKQVALSDFVTFMEGASGIDAVNGNLTVGGNLTVNGTTTTVNSTTVTIDDPIFTLGGDTAPGSDDNKDRGIEFRYYDSQARVGFFGFDDSTGYFTALGAATNSSEVFSGTVLPAQFGSTNVSKLEIDGTAGSSGDYIDVSTDLTIVSSADIKLDPTGGDVQIDGNILPTTNSDLGSASYLLGDVYINDDKKLKFGASADFTIEYDEDDQDVAQFAGANMRIGHGAATELQFRDSGLKIYSSGNGQLDIDSDGEIELAATTNLDMDAADVQLNSSATTTVTSGTNMILQSTAGNVTVLADAADKAVVIKGDHASGVAVHIDGDQAAGSIVDIDAGELTIDASAGIAVVSTEAAADSILLHANNAAGGIDLTVNSNVMLSIDANSADFGASAAAVTFASTADATAVDTGAIQTQGGISAKKGLYVSGSTSRIATLGSMYGSNTTFADGAFANANQVVHIGGALGLFNVDGGTTNGKAALEGLSNSSALSAGTYNGRIIYLRSAYNRTGTDAIHYLAADNFDTANKFYFCENGVWHSSVFAAAEE